MRLYLALSYPEAVGGVISIGRLQRHLSALGELVRERERERENDMRLYLATWEPGHGDSKNVSTRFVSGTDQWNMLEDFAKKSMRLKILLSYWYYKDSDLDALFAKYFTEPYPEVFADSGAFSAMTQGASVNLKEYAQWIKRYRHLFSVYSNLDVIRNAQKTWENQQELEQMGLSPLPTFHVAENFDWLEKYVELYKYIALGVAGNQRMYNELMAWFSRCFKIANNQAVFHGFGITTWKYISSFRWYSVDSSSWGSGFRFGTVPVFNSKIGRFEKCNLGDIKSCLAVSELLEDMGFNWKDFADRKRNDRAKICAVSALSYIRAEQYLQKKLGKVYIPGDNGAPAVLRAHLADANPARIGEAEARLRLHLADTGGIKENYHLAESGLRVHLADARGHTAADKSATEHGLKLHLAEHSLDRGGVGDTSRALRVLYEKDSL